MKKAFTFFATIAFLLSFRSVTFPSDGMASVAPRAARAVTTVGCPAPSNIISRLGSSGQTTSRVFSSIAGSSVTFKSAAPGCVIVSFSAEAFVDDGGAPGNIMFLRALLDGALGPDGKIQFQTDSITWSN